MIDPISGEEWIRRLRTLQGDFRPPRLTLIVVQILTAAVIGMGAYILFRASKLYEYTHSLLNLIYGIAFGGGALVVGFLQQRRAACGYRFADGQIRFISGSGRVLWAEDLAALERINPGPSRKEGPDVLDLHWGKKMRRVYLLASLRAALNEAGNAS